MSGYSRLLTPHSIITKQSNIIVVYTYNSVMQSVSSNGTVVHTLEVMFVVFVERFLEVLVFRESGLGLKAFDEFIALCQVFTACTLACDT